MNYKVLITDEATNDVFNLVKYIHVDLCNPDAAKKAIYEFKQGSQQPWGFIYHFSKYREQNNNRKNMLRNMLKQVLRRVNSYGTIIPLFVVP